MPKKPPEQRRVKITQPRPPAEEVETEVLATAIVNISEAAERLLNGPLARRAVCVLVRDMTSPPVPLSTIELVLDSAAGLKKRYVKGRS